MIYLNNFLEFNSCCGGNTGLDNSRLRLTAIPYSRVHLIDYNCFAILWLTNNFPYNSDLLIVFYICKRFWNITGMLIKLFWQCTTLTILATTITILERQVSHKIHKPEPKSAHDTYNSRGERVHHAHSQPFSGSANLIHKPEPARVHYTHKPEPESAPHTHKPEFPLVHRSLFSFLTLLFCFFFQDAA